MQYLLTFLIHFNLNKINQTINKYVTGFYVHTSKAKSGK